MIGRWSFGGAGFSPFGVKGSFRLAVFIGGVALYALTPVVLAQPAPPPAGPALVSAADKQKAEDLAKAIETCDRGAAVPLDADAKAPPVPYFDLFPADFDLSKLQPLAEACEKAAAGAPDEKRFRLQALRVRLAIDFKGAEALAPELREVADAGSAEARFLVFQIFETNRLRGQNVVFGITREEALKDLDAAAEAGHQTALILLAGQYASGPLYRRDPVKAVETLRKAQTAQQQGPQPALHEAEARETAGFRAIEIILSSDGFPLEEQKAAFAEADKSTKSGADPSADFFLPYVDALRYGRGTEKDPAKARALLEERVSAGQKIMVPRLADMVAAGEGGPADVRRALVMLRDPDQKYVLAGGPVLARLLLDGKVVGRQPVEAMRSLARSYDVDAFVRLAGLLLDYHPRIDWPKDLVGELADAAAVGHPGAGLALARLKLSDDGAFTDVDGARKILKPLADAGDKDALWLFAGSQYANLDTNSFRPLRREGGFSDDELKQIIADGLKDKRPEAYLLSAKLLRRGALWPQDDQAATKALISAANLGSVEGMVLLGDAYDDGLGIDKNPRERLHAWREAAARGSLKARQKLADAFAFDSFDKLMTLREGVTERIALYNDGVGRSAGLGMMGDSEAAMAFSGLFSGGRASDAGAGALAAAVMDGFRIAPAGLEERTLVGIGKALPDEVRIEIEKTLKADGFYQGEAKGYFGPDARKALAVWADAKGPTLNDAGGAPQAARPAPTAGPQIAGSVAPEVVARVSGWAAGRAIKTKAERTQTIRVINVLARYGDVGARWALVNNYHEADYVRNNVTPAELTRYALDLMVSRPAGVDKLDFAVTFDLVEINNQGAMAKFGDAALAAMRDDARLQDPLTFGGIAKQFVFAPGACDALLAAGKRAGVGGLGDDGCEEAARTGLIAYAKSKGPAGIDGEARKAAATEIAAMDERMAKAGSPIEDVSTAPAKKGKRK